MDDAQARVQKAVNSMWNTLDKDCLRKVQIEMLNCSLDCCKNQSLNIEEVQGCMERCSSKLSNTQTFIQNELQMFEDRLQRCVRDCQDRTKDQIGPNPSETELHKHKAGLEKCVVKCVDNHIDLFPNFIKKLTESIKKS
ncbi:hypothetical protein LOTGIDRAFT_218054 [Lottia gigantea]|uniref:Protein FAM136A n=1 Tax=Lottia gigantea TaxID=225164 RepID=V4AAQ4_LOTGI|nr:hypothetical protein LOTGIDRAFT_218054 [Lottia gigantea]ESO90366.1 hypothetical protein LOTGIDRAFT_218054 [Lottia gigantea]